MLCLMLVLVMLLLVPLLPSAGAFATLYFVAEVLWAFGVFPCSKMFLDLLRSILVVARNALLRSGFDQFLLFGTHFDHWAGPGPGRLAFLSSRLTFLVQHASCTTRTPSKGKIRDQNPPDPRDPKILDLICFYWGFRGPEWFHDVP